MSFALGRIGPLLNLFNQDYNLNKRKEYLKNVYDAMIPYKRQGGGGYGL